MKRLINRTKILIGLCLLCISFIGCGNQQEKVSTLHPTTITLVPSQTATPTSTFTQTVALLPPSTLLQTPKVAATAKPTAKPTIKPAIQPTTKSVKQPTAKPTVKPTEKPEPTKAPNVKPSFTGKAYVIIDASSGKTLASKNKTKRIYPASTIKLLTALTAIEHGGLKEKITARKEILRAIDSDVTKMGVVPGTTHTLGQWLNIMLISSYGDAANTIADGVSGGDIDQFIEWMNDKAEELGMEHTHVDNAIGLDIGNGFTKIYSTAEDLGKLAVASMKSNTVRSIVKKVTYKTTATKQMKSMTIRTTNRFFRDSNYESKLFDIIGTKTGHTKAAGYCLIATASDENGRELICVYLGGTSRASMYKEIKSMFEYYYKND